MDSDLRVEPAAINKFEKILIEIAKSRAKLIQQRCIDNKRKTIREEDIDEKDNDVKVEN